jgi:hypothetical protein
MAAWAAEYPPIPIADQEHFAFQNGAIKILRHLRAAF